MRWKWSLVKALFEKGLGRAEVLELFRFIDWVMVLPEELDLRFQETLREFEEERKMPYITSVERAGIKKGLEQGLEQGKRCLLVRQIRTRFGAECASAAERILGRVHASEELDRAGDFIVECKTGTELLKRLEPLAGSDEPKNTSPG